MERLTYSTKEINRNFKIKVSGMYEGKKLQHWRAIAENCKGWVIEEIQIE